MSDEEIICRFMEPKPTPGITAYRNGYSINGWWALSRVSADLSRTSLKPEWKPALPFRDKHEWLGWLHEVEGRLSKEQWAVYRDGVWAQVSMSGLPSWQWALHATAEQKIAALADVLRREIQK